MSQDTEKKYFLMIKIKLFIFGLLGLAPFRMKVEHIIVQNGNSGSKPILRFVGSYYSASYNLGLMIFLISLNIIYVPSMLSERPDDNSLLSKVLEVCLILSGNFILIGLLFNYSVRYETMINIVNKLTDIDIAMMNLPDHDQITRLLNGRFYLTLAFSLNWVFCVALIFSEIFSEKRFWTTLCLSLLHSIIFSFTILQYAIVLSLIKIRFRCINDAFLKLSKSSCEFYCHARHSPKINVNRVTIRIVTLKRAHSILCDICAQVADFYSLSIIFIMTYFTASIIYSVYHFIIPLIRPETFETTSINCMRILAWLLIEIFPISFLTTNATNATSEMKKTSDIIDKISDQYIVSQEIESEVDHCSLELLHNDFEFTAFDVVAIDNTILRSIFSAVITYLIIFIQFQLSGIRRING